MNTFASEEMKPPSAFTTRAGSLTDLNSLQRLYVETINSVCTSDYNEEQIAVWTSGVENEARWEAVFREQWVLLALREDRIVGFATLHQGTYIDFFYVHRDFQGQGVASLLYTELEKEAHARGTRILSGDISRTARPFFESRGFCVEAEQIFLLKGVLISNFRMSKLL